MGTKLKRTTKILIIVCLIGLSLLLYPSFSNYWNAKHATKAINTYVESLEGINDELYKNTWNEAVQYNKDLLKRTNSYALTGDLKKRYHECLDVSGIGVMGYIEIPKIDVSLPIYHGTSENVLQQAIGHIDWSSLPVGGESTHCVISGHRGLPSAKLFTELDKLRDGDLFTLDVLNEVLTYEVDRVLTVEPQDVETLTITEGRDYCTLVTCTPYGVNTHRLLVRGHRVENVVSEARVVSEAVVIDPLVVAPVVASPILFALILAIMLKKPEKKKGSAPDTEIPEEAETEEETQTETNAETEAKTETENKAETKTETQTVKGKNTLS